MPMDGLTLGFLAAELNGVLRGGRVERIQQPERDELLLTIRSQGASHRLLLSASANHSRVHLTRRSRTSPAEPPMFCMLLRKHLSGAYVMGFQQVGGDRVLVMEMEGTSELGERGARRLVVEIMGRHSNIMLLDETDRIVDSIRHVDADMSRVREVLPGLRYQAPPSQGKLDPAKADEVALEGILSVGGRLAKALAAGIAGFSNQAGQEFAHRLTGDSQALLEDWDRALLARRLKALLAELHGWGPPVSLEDGEGSVLDAFAYPQQGLDQRLQKSMPSLSAALEACFTARDEGERMKQRSQALRKTLKTHVERCEKKRGALMETLQAGEQLELLRMQGELLTANLYRMSKSASAITVDNYYLPDSPPLTIALDTKLSPVQNAQAYFKRYQKLRAARDMAAGQLEKAERELHLLETQWEDLDKCTQEAELEEIRQLLVEGGYVRASHSRRGVRKLPASKPYRYRSEDGIEIWVGKNSVQNDRLTAGAQGEETWLHAKDMPGSHVLVKHQGPLPEATLEQALQLAAWYSKGKRSANVPVDHTLRRHVKKPGGTPPGYVTYTNQRTRYVTPDERVIKKITLLEE